MRQFHYVLSVLLAFGALAAEAQQRGPVLGGAGRGAPQQEAQQSQAPAPPVGPARTYSLAVASFAPLNSDIFIADSDGRNAKAFLPDRDALDYNASFSPDGRWVVFTSTRGGSADIYRARPDGSKLE